WATDRKLRLFGCGCCRGIWDLLPDAPCRDAVVLAEKHADGLAVDAPFALAGRAVRAAVKEERPSSGRRAVSAVEAVTIPAAWAGAGHAAAAAAWARRGHRRMTQVRGQADLLRCIFGPLPFRQPPPIDPLWLARNDGVVKRLAESAYQERAL